MSQKVHLTPEGLQQIINIRASMNWGLSEKLKSEFIDHTPIFRPFIDTTKIADPNWLAGFTTGESNFGVHIQKSNTKIGHQVRLKFIISQHERDIKLMNLIMQYIGCGQIYKKKFRQKSCRISCNKNYWHYRNNNTIVY